MSEGSEAHFICRGRTPIDDRAPPRVFHDVAAFPDDFAHAVAVANLYRRAVRITDIGPRAISRSGAAFGTATAVSIAVTTAITVPRYCHCHRYCHCRCRCRRYFRCRCRHYFHCRCRHRCRCPPLSASAVWSLSVSEVPETTTLQGIATSNRPIDTTAQGCTEPSTCEHRHSLRIPRFLPDRGLGNHHYPIWPSLECTLENHPA